MNNNWEVVIKLLRMNGIRYGWTEDGDIQILKKWHEKPEKKEVPVVPTKITLTWFKDTGKYYTDEEIIFPRQGHVYGEIVAWVREEKKYRNDRPANICLVEIEGEIVRRLIIY